MADLSTPEGKLVDRADEADHALIDKYRDPKTGVFNFPTDVAKIIRTLERRAAEAEEAEDEAKDCFWAVYPTYVRTVGHGISTEAARTELADRAIAAERERDELKAEVKRLRDALGIPKLFPCRCGSEDCYLFVNERNYQVECENCARISPKFWTEDEARAWWNARAALRTEESP